MCLMRIATVEAH